MPPRGSEPSLFESARWLRDNRARAPAFRRLAPPRKAFPKFDTSAKWNRGSEPECSLLRAGALLSHDAGIFSRLSLERTLDRSTLLIEFQRVGDFLHLVIGQAGVEQRRRFEL